MTRPDSDYQATSQTKPPRPSKPVRRPTCAATTAAGTPCPSGSMVGSDRCFQHRNDDPALVERRTLARQRGGFNATLRKGLDNFPLPNLGTTGEVQKLLEATAAAVASGALAPAQANSLANLCGVAVRLFEMALSEKLHDLEELDAKLRGENPGSGPRIVVAAGKEA
jgi:hypothetical protein